MNWPNTWYLVETNTENNQMAYKLANAWSVVESDTKNGQLACKLALYCKKHYLNY